MAKMNELKSIYELILDHFVKIVILLKQKNGKTKRLINRDKLADLANIFLYNMLRKKKQKLFINMFASIVNNLVYFFIQ